MESETRRERLRRFEDVCRRRGLSLTVQRRAILEAVLDRADHPTADRVFDEVSRRIPGVSRTTVYRVLEMLVEVGVITKACSPGAATRFDPMTHRHHHLVCLHCDKLIDLEDAELDRRIKLPSSKSHSFEIRDFSVHFRGICAECQRKLRAQGDAASAKASRGSGRTVNKTGKQAKRTRKQPSPKRRTRR